MKLMADMQCQGVTAALADVTPPTPSEISGLGRTPLREDLPLQIATEHQDVRLDTMDWASSDCTELESRKT